uniref:Uncharacterized protein n=1 Tax=Rhizophora mucronata TaxID=61149 RepID=A0A2P2P8N7_RHIMU
MNFFFICFSMYIDIAVCNLSSHCESCIFSHI